MFVPVLRTYGCVVTDYPDQTVGPIRCRRFAAPDRIFRVEHDWVGSYLVVMGTLCANADDFFADKTVRQQREYDVPAFHTSPTRKRGSSQCPSLARRASVSISFRRYDRKVSNRSTCFALFQRSLL